MNCSVFGPDGQNSGPLHRRCFAICSRLCWSKLSLRNIKEVLTTQTKHFSFQKSVSRSFPQRKLGEELLWKLERVFCYSRVSSWLPPALRGVTDPWSIICSLHLSSSLRYTDSNNVFILTDKKAQKSTSQLLHCVK